MWFKTKQFSCSLVFLAHTVKLRSQFELTILVMIVEQYFSRRPVGAYKQGGRSGRQAGLASEQSADGPYSVLWPNAGQELAETAPGRTSLLPHCPGSRTHLLRWPSKVQSCHISDRTALASAPPTYNRKSNG